MWEWVNFGHISAITGDIYLKLGMYVHFQKSKTTIKGDNSVHFCNYVPFSLYTTQFLILTTLKEKAFENILGKRKNAGNKHFLL